MTNPTGKNPDSAAGFGGLGLVGGLFGAGAQIYDTYQTNKTARENTDKTNAARKAEAELAYQRQVEMWHMQNAYNSPEEQMRRFGAAGLNPHLIYSQGNPGNSSGTPNYQPANVQYRYAAPTYGASVQSVLPTLMAVGSWMQNMRMSEVDIQSKKTGIEKAEQMVEFLAQQNPRKIRELDNRLSLYPYQRSLLFSNQEYAQERVEDIRRKIAFQYGSPHPNYQPGGFSQLLMMQQEAKTRLEQAKASFTDFNITNPQAIMQMVLGGVMGLAGQQLRLSTYRSNSSAARELRKFRKTKDGWVKGD